MRSRRDRSVGQSVSATASASLMVPYWGRPLMRSSTYPSKEYWAASVDEAYELPAETALASRPTCHVAVEEALRGHSEANREH